jgi:hypothetical protein
MADNIVRTSIKPLKCCILDKGLAEDSLVSRTWSFTSEEIVGLQGSLLCKEQVTQERCANNLRIMQVIYKYLYMYETHMS